MEDDGTRLPIYWWELEMGLPLYWWELECGGWRERVTHRLIEVKDGVTPVLLGVRVWRMEGCGYPCTGGS